MEKILKKYTTIPNHLYVNRDADIQLRRIVEEMQRPGYVLVARQMGKTNLLFNAKRTLENENRLFAYVDLSNLYDNERDCYRNIINNIIEPNLDKFALLEHEIQKIRDNNFPAHNEYSRCLRLILNHYQGDLIIILDEIDALKSVNYSDNIFAQIRSNYFSRTNFPVFEKLSYILSGVIEPTELIKDKNKSPFNIGDKIYLDDFSKAEHDIFIQKSKLPISKEVSQEIFNWTNGNPRLTFDICSEVENSLLKGVSVDIKILEKIIREKYLTDFDIAPIDHIRELVKNDKACRESIKSIHKRKFDELNDESKKKLYLYGIISSKFDNEIRIKNKIIEYTLSEEWIKSIESGKDISVVYGLAKYDEEKYIDAIEILKAVLVSPKFLGLESEIQTANYFIGLSYYKLRNYQEAQFYFAQNFDEALFNDAKSFLGICKIATNQKEEGIEILEECIKIEGDTAGYYSALANLALNIDDSERQYALLEKLYTSTFNSKIVEKSELDSFRKLALFYQHELLVKDHKKDEALQKIELAFDYCNNSDSLYLYYCKYLLLPDEQNLKNIIVNTIVENNLRFDQEDNNILSFQEDSLLIYLELIFDKTDLKLFERLLEYSLSNLYPKLKKYALVFNITLIPSLKKIDILKYILKDESNIPKEELIVIYRTLAFSNSQNKHDFLEAFNGYSKLFLSNELLVKEDIYIFSLAIRLFSDANKVKEALFLCEIIKNRVSITEDEELIFESVIIYYWYSVLSFGIKNKSDAVKYSDIALNLIGSSNRKKTSMLDEEGLKLIGEQLKTIKKSIYNATPVIAEKKIERNEKIKVKYTDGTIIEKKYKFLEADLIAGRCKRF